MSATESVEYDYEGRKVGYKIRPISFGEYQKVLGTVGNVEVIGNTTKGRIDTTRLIDDIMKLSVSGDVDYHLLSIVDGMDLQERVLRVNGLGDKGPSFPSQ